MTREEDLPLGPDGSRYGTAAQLADLLGADVTTTMIRRWAQRDGLPAHHQPGPGRGTVLYPLDHAAEIERAKRRSPRGRPRSIRPA